MKDCPLLCKLTYIMQESHVDCANDISGSMQARHIYLHVTLCRERPSWFKAPINKSVCGIQQAVKGATDSQLRSVMCILSCWHDGYPYLHLPLRFHSLKSGSFT